MLASWWRWRGKPKDYCGHLIHPPGIINILSKLHGTPYDHCLADWPAFLCHDSHADMSQCWCDCFWVDRASPFLGSDDEQIIEKEEVDGHKLHPHVKDSSSFGHFLQFSLLLQEPCLGDDRDCLKEIFRRSAKTLTNKTNVQILSGTWPYLELIELQRLRNMD